MQGRVYNTPDRDTSDLEQRLIDTRASISTKHVHAWRQNDITLNICQTKTGTFQSHHPKVPVLVKATNSLPRNTRYGSRRFRRKFLKQIKYIKVKGQGQLNMHNYQCADAIYQKISN